MSKRIALIEVQVARLLETLADKRAFLRTVERAWHAEEYEWQFLTLRRAHTTDELAQLHRKTSQSIILHESLIAQHKAEIDELRETRMDTAKMNHVLRNAPMGNWEQQTLFTD